MLTKQKCTVNDKAMVKWVDVPVEKSDIIGYLEDRMSYIEADFKYLTLSDFVEDIEFFHCVVIALGDLDILTYQEVREYLHKYAEFCVRYRELRKELKKK